MTLFENAPISLVLSGLTLLLTMLYGGSPNVSLDVARIVEHKEAFFAMVILFTCRLFERQLGMKKYGAFFFVCLFITLLVNLALAFSLYSMGIHFVPASGPYFFIFAQLALFHKYVPKISMTQYVCLGVEFSEKSWIYLLALQLLMGEGMGSVVAGLTGLLTGCLYDINLLGLQKLRAPVFIERSIGLLNNIFSSLTPSNRDPRQAHGQRNEPLPREAAAEQPSLYGSMAPQGGFGGFEMPPPDEESILTLMNLGFEREAVIRALRASGNNVDAAANRLLS